MINPSDTQNDTSKLDAPNSETFLDQEFYEAEYKLQNCIRVTTNVEDFTTEVYTGLRWIPVTEYVVALLAQREQTAELRGEQMWFQWMIDEVGYEKAEAYLAIKEVEGRLNEVQRAYESAINSTAHGHMIDLRSRIDRLLEESKSQLTSQHPHDRSDGHVCSECMERTNKEDR